MTTDDAFMSSLFADLDNSSGWGSDLILSSSPPKAGQTAATTSRPNEALTNRLKPRSQDAAAGSTSAELRASTHQRSQQQHDDTSSRTQTSIQPAEPASFWDNPYAHPVARFDKRKQQERKTIAPNVIRGPSAPNTQPQSKLPKQRRSPATTVATTITSTTTVPTRPRGALKHVAIRVEPLNTELDNKSKGKNPVEPKDVTEDANLWDDVDWNDHDWMSSSLAQDQAKVEPEPVAQSQRYKRCTVVSVDNLLHDATRRPYRVISVESSSFNGQRNIHVFDDWLQSTVEQGDVVNVVGGFDVDANPSSLIDRNQGMLILHPDILVSSTKVGDSANCSRKALLQELIRTLGGSNNSLIYGNMLHELMQKLMIENKWDDEFRKQTIRDIIRGQIQQLWTVDLDVGKAYETMLDKSKELSAFKHAFFANDQGGRDVNGQPPRPEGKIEDLRSNATDPARLAITKTLAVEEDIWSPKYGLKGKIDVSVTGVVTNNDIETRTAATMPFEIKTGRTNAGMEHRAQTLLYTLLISDRYNEDVASGLLYYSQSNSVVRIQAARNELRGLLIARNEFATHLHRRMTLTPSKALPGMTQTQTQAGPPGLTQSPVISKAAHPTPEKQELLRSLDSDEEALWAAAGGSIDEELDLADIEAEPQLLPASIDDERTCGKCYVKDACMLYRRAVDREDVLSEDPNSALQGDFEERTGFLTEKHKKFFRHWERLVSLEEQEVVRNKKEIWTMGAEERMKAGRCLANMSIDTSFMCATPSIGTRIHRYTYRLHHASSLLSQATASQHAARSLLGGTIKVNDPIVVSLERPYVLGIARGFVLELTARTIVLGLDRPLETVPQAARASPPSTKPGDLVFRIDEDELAAGLGRLRDNLIQLFVTNGDERRRRLVVDLEPPAFEPGLLITDEVTRKRFIPDRLNVDQQAAVEKVLSAKDYALILGMPGTGKTTSIAEIVKALANAGKSILLTAYTHSAVDNVLLKLVEMPQLSILRLGNRDKIMQRLHGLTLDPSNPPETLTEVDNALMMPQIVATTCSGINEPIFTKRRFDVCIVDEASQVTLPACLGPLRFANTFVLVGDHNQLPPLVRNRAARKAGLDESLFKRLSDAHPRAVANLSLQYRMNSDIMLLSNRLIYRDQLKCGSNEVAERRLELKNRGALRDLLVKSEAEWLDAVVDPDRAVVFLQTDKMPALERRIGSRFDNAGEAKIVLHSTEALLRCGVQPQDIGVITPYRHQHKLLSRKLEHVPEVEVLTADRSQGRDKECIIMSLVRSNDGNHVGELLKDWRRINVCLTRAKTKLILIGSRTTLSSLKLLDKFFKLVDEKSWQVDISAQVNLLAEGVVLGMTQATKFKRSGEEVPHGTKDEQAVIVTSSPMTSKDEDKENARSSDANLDRKGSSRKKIRVSASNVVNDEDEWIDWFPSSPLLEHRLEQAS
ncbi:DNA replication endonuclease-helicase Dna2 [Microbotryomycetes sp. JL221]|nr:DNA replication endonuclease-helicase Dna2 [Microbotryomycetes sp. JL221]